MALTTIGDQKTPGRPIEITFAPNLALPSANQQVLLVGHAASGGASGSSSSYQVQTMNNVADLTAAQAEAETKYGVGSELSKMVVAAVAALQGGGTFPVIKCVALPFAEASFGPASEATKAIDKTQADYVVSPYDGATDSANLLKLKTLTAGMSGAQRVHNNQFGSFGVAANTSVVDPSTLPSPDTQFLALVYLRDTSGSAYSVGEFAAAYAALLAANGVPFNPLDNVTIPSAPAPVLLSDYLSIGAGLESEVVLNKGWTPLKVKPNGEVAIVRATTARITIDGTIPATAYYDVMDFNVLYFWRKTEFTRLSQPDLVQVKASLQVAILIKSELIRLASAFEDQGMFQAVALLAKLFKVERSASDRHRFDVFTPVNVIPGLHVVAANVSATVQGDTISV